MENEAQYEIQQGKVIETIEQEPLVTVFDREEVESKLASAEQRKADLQLEIDGADQEVNRFKTMLEKFSG